MHFFHSSDLKTAVGNGELLFFFFFSVAFLYFISKSKRSSKTEMVQSSSRTIV